MLDQRGMLRTEGGYCTLSTGQDVQMPKGLQPGVDGYIMQIGRSGYNEKWMHMAEALPGTNRQDCAGVAGHHPLFKRQGAAQKMIENHEAVLRDICNPSPAMNVIGHELTQRDLKRVPDHQAQYVDDFLREMVRRLMGCVTKDNRPIPQVQCVNPQVWNHAAHFLSARLHSSAGEVEQTPAQQRTPDMDGGTARVMRAVAMDVAMNPAC